MRGKTWVLGAVLAFGAPREASAECPRDTAAALADAGDKLRAVNLSAAIDKYVLASRTDPSSHRILYKLGAAYVKAEDWKKADQALRRACTLAPTFASYFFLRGFALEHLAQWPEAREALAQAAVLDPSWADPHFDLGEVWQHDKEEGKAASEYVRAIRLAPDAIAFYGPLAELYVRLGFYDAADQVVGEALARAAPDDRNRYVLHTLRGVVLERKGDARGAMRAYEEARAACGACDERNQAAVYFNLGSAYARVSPPRKAEAVTNLLTFQKRICRGGAAARYADECVQTQELLRALGAP